MGDENLDAISDHELTAAIRSYDTELKRLHNEQMAEERVRQWVAGFQHHFKNLGPAAELEGQLRSLGASVLFSVPAIAQEIETAVLAQVTPGPLSTDERQQRIEKLTSERNRLGGENERRAKAQDSGSTIKAVGPTTATAKITFRRNGTVFAETNEIAGREALGRLRQLSRSWCSHTKIKHYPWVIRAELVSGDTPEGPQLGVWHSIYIDRSWHLTLSGVGSRSAELSISISKTNGQSVDSEIMYRLAAEVPGDIP